MFKRYKTNHIECSHCLKAVATLKDTNTGAHTFVCMENFTYL